MWRALLCLAVFGLASTARADSPYEGPAERRFSPHVTLCRPRAGTARELAAMSGGHDWPGMFAANGLADWGACPTTDLVLYQSGGQQQIRYRALARWPLVAA